MIPTERQLDGLREMISTGIGKAAEVLNTMLNSRIDLEVPALKVLVSDECKNEMDAFGPDQLAAVDLGFKGNFSGSAQLIFTAETASKLVSTLIDESIDINDLDTIRAGTLTEIGNIVLNGVMGSIANALQSHFSYTVPNYMEGDMASLMGASDMVSGQTILLAKTRFSVEELDIIGDIALFFGVNFNELLDTINGMAEQTG